MAVINEVDNFFLLKGDQYAHVMSQMVYDQLSF